MSHATSIIRPTDAPRRVRRRAETGFSLIEVMLAAALLGFVLVSIAGVFAVGAQSVHSGRQLTEATTLANSAMEQVIAWPYDKVWGMTGGTATASSAVFRTDEANPAYTGDPNDIADWTETADAWREAAQAALNDGTLIYRVQGVKKAPTPGSTESWTEPFREAEVLLVTVGVTWVEARGRQREVVFQEIKL